MEQAELTVARLRLRDGSLRAEGRLRHPNGHTHTIFFEVPRAQAGWITPHADPFVVAFIIPLMSLGVPVRVRGGVTARLLDHLTEFQRIMARWFPGELRPVEIRPDRIARPRRPARESSPLLTFSGGTDSMFSAWSWMQPSRGGRRLRWAVMAHGFDIPLESVDYFREYERSLRGPLADQGVTLFTVRTNGMETAAAYGLKWGKTHHGPATAALLLLFQKKFDLGVLASTYVCDNVTTGWGSTSLTDPLLGSGDMTILHDGAASDRVDKIRALAAWPEGLAVMRVCWTWPRTVANCGACYKCIYVRLAMAILGVPERSSFAAPLTVEAVRNLDLKAAPNVRNWERMLKIATDVTPASPWIPPIREAIDRGRARYGGSAPMGDSGPIPGPGRVASTL